MGGGIEKSEKAKLSIFFSELSQRPAGPPCTQEEMAIEENGPFALRVPRRDNISFRSGRSSQLQREKCLAFQFPTQSSL